MGRQLPSHRKGETLIERASCRPHIRERKGTKGKSWSLSRRVRGESASSLGSLVIYRVIEINRGGRQLLMPKPYRTLRRLWDFEIFSESLDLETFSAILDFEIFSHISDLVDFSGSLDFENFLEKFEIIIFWFYLTFHIYLIKIFFNII